VPEPASSVIPMLARTRGPGALNPVHRSWPVTDFRGHRRTCACRRY